MTATVVTFSTEVQSKIDELKEENYYDVDMFAFINVHGEANFLAHYEEYVEQGEEYSYDAVDAFVDEFGVENVQYFQDAYQGEYSSEEQFAEQFVNDIYGEVPDYLVVDWTATWEQNLQYDFAINNGFVFNKNF